MQIIIAYNPKSNGNWAQKMFNKSTNKKRKMAKTKNKKHQRQQKKEKTFLQKIMDIRGVTIKELAKAVKLSPEQTSSRIQEGRFDSTEIPAMAKLLQVDGGKLYLMIVAHPHKMAEEAFRDSITPITKTK